MAKRRDKITAQAYEVPGWAEYQARMAAVEVTRDELVATNFSRLEVGDVLHCHTAAGIPYTLRVLWVHITAPNAYKPTEGRWYRFERTHGAHVGEATR